MMLIRCRQSFNRADGVGLAGKLSLLITFGVLVSVGLLGVYFDYFLKNNFREDADKRMLYGFQQLESDLAAVSQELQEGISFVRTDDSFLASVNLINNYQETEKYNAILLDEEKKLLARQLLNRVKLSLNHYIVLFDQDEDLIAFVEQRPDGAYYLHFVSYENGSKVLCSRRENEEQYSRHPFPKTLPVDFHHRAYYSDSTAEQGTVTYHIRNGQFLITSHLSFFDSLKHAMVMHIEMSHLFDDAYFRELSNDLDLIVRSRTEQEKAGDVPTLSDINRTKKISVIEGKRAYFSAAKMTTLDSDFFYHVVLNKEKLLSTLARNRQHFFALLVLVAVLVLVLLRAVFSRTLINPLELLMQQIRTIEQQDYAQCSLVQTGDELETISRNINHLSCTVQDREKALLASQRELEYLSHHDPLTDLPNRRLFNVRLQEAVKEAESAGTRLAVLFLDLDEFKQVNDTLGHDMGDRLLVEISLRLAAAVPSFIILARLGGDEFTLFMQDVQSRKEVIQTAEKLLAEFTEPFLCEEHELSTTASIGIALYPDDGRDTVTLIKHADMAMYQVKETGRNGYSFFSADLALYVRQRMEHTNALKKALVHSDEFHLLYQPKISLLTGRIEGMEALVRWQSPELGFMRPDQFIALAEETRLIIPLGAWILEQAMRDFLHFRENGCRMSKVSINVSSVQLLHSDMTATVQQAIRHTGMLPQQIELELTESSLATDEDKALRTLTRLREMGIELAIDDFGTGYSSMSYLQKFPVTRLKIDKSFVDDLPGSEESRAIIHAIIALARTFHLALTAEGVETKEQLAFLRNAGCHEAQGYYYAKPLSPEEFVEFFRAFRGGGKSAGKTFFS
ncbi:MAG: EAL domain-containing protein [Candidatus Electrothrix sp. YB6]